MKNTDIGAAGWIESYEDFVSWLEDLAPLDVEMPAWGSGAAVRVVVIKGEWPVPVVIFYRRADWLEVKRFRKLERSGKLAIRLLDEDLTGQGWHNLAITADILAANESEP